MNLAAGLDNLIAVFAPAWAASRAAHRRNLEVLQASTAGGRRHRNNGLPPAQRFFEPDHFARQAGRVNQRQRDRDDSRQLVNTNPVAQALVEAFVDHVWGEGIELRSTIPDPALAARFTEAFTAWATAEEGVDVRGRNLDQFGREFVRSGKTDGDVAVAKKADGRLQLLTADRLWYAGRAGPEDPLIIDGVAVDDYGNPLAYHVRTADLRTVRVPGDQVIFHRFDWEHPDDVRGRPLGATTYDLYEKIDGIEDATAVAARLAANLALVVTNDLNEPAGRPAETETEPGMLVELRRGQDIKPIQGAHPQQQLSPFLNSLLRRIGAAERIPLEVLCMDFTQGSYSAIHAALMIWQYRVKTVQDDLAFGPLAKLYRWWVRRQIALEKLPDVPGAEAHVWTPKPAAYLFPKEQTESDAMQVETGIKSFQEWCEERGKDWRKLVEAHAEVEAFLRQKRVRFARTAATRDPAPEPQPADKPPEAQAA